MITTQGLRLIDHETKHEPGFAVPRKSFTRSDVEREFLERGIRLPDPKWPGARYEIVYSFDVQPPPIFLKDAGWCMLMLAKHPCRKDPFLSRMSTPYRPAKNAEEWFLVSAIDGSERFFAAIAAGLSPAQAEMALANRQAQQKQEVAAVLNAPRKRVFPWLPHLKRG